MRVYFYTKTNGKSPVLDYIDELNVKDKAKLLACLKSIEEMGFDSLRVEFRQNEE